MGKGILTYNIAYFKGILHTYAFLNDPGVNISYRFDINDFSMNDTIVTDLKKEFDYFHEYDITFEEISRDSFEKLLNGWLFTEFQPNSVQHIPTMTIIKYLVDDLVDNLAVTEFYKMTSIKLNKENAIDEFGYAVDFVVLAGEKKRYFCEFTVG